VLTTSRSVLPGLEVDERIDLDVLPADEATALLAGLIGTQRAAAEPAAVEQVAGWCGWLPLALRIAGQLLAAHPAWPVAKLARMLSGERPRLQQLAAGDLRVRAAFEVSYRQMADKDARMFRQLGLHPGPDFDAVAAASLAGIEKKAAELLLDRLVLAHLVTEDRSGRFGLHDLLRLFARDTCHETDDQATRDAAEARLVGHYAGLALAHSQFKPNRLPQHRKTRPLRALAVACSSQPRCASFVVAALSTGGWMARFTARAVT
jgi:hypothetical protein